MINDDNRLNKTYTQSELDKAFRLGYEEREKVASEQLIKLKEENKLLKEKLNGNN